MAKKLFIIRHAKSCWKDPQVEDFSRKLNERGKKDLKFMPHELEKIFTPDLILVSPARRTMKTAEKILKNTSWDPEVEFMYQLYDADLSTLLSVLNKLDKKFNNVAIVGHNNGLTDLVNHLQNKLIENVPTLGCVKISFASNDWGEVGKIKGKLEKFIFPKMFKDLGEDNDVSKN